MPHPSLSLLWLAVAHPNRTPMPDMFPQLA
jgi:hypothetical protein